MSFISLGDVLTSVAEAIQLPPHGMDKVSDIGLLSEKAVSDFWNVANRDVGEFSVNEKIEWARKMSLAALWLNKALHDCVDAPVHWMEFDEIKCFAVRMEPVRAEGVELLTHASGWGSREQDNCCAHFRNAISLGDDALKAPIIRGLSDGLCREGELLRLLKIGFNRAELVAFLDGCGIAHDLGGGIDLPNSSCSNKGNNGAKPPLQQQFQEKEILRVINKLGYDPKNLPPRPAGKSGVKAEVREELIQEKIFQREGTVFKKAWERLRFNKEIQGAK